MLLFSLLEIGVKDQSSFQGSIISIHIEQNNNHIIQLYVTLYIQTFCRKALNPKKMRSPFLKKTPFPPCFSTLNDFISRLLVCDSGAKQALNTQLSPIEVVE